MSKGDIKAGLFLASLLAVLAVLVTSIHRMMV
jgi:hypothetical protein